jgi:transposase-like protein
MSGQQTVNEIAATDGVHPNQVLPWKKQALEVLPDVFSSRRMRAAQDDEALQARLYQQIGPLIAVDVPDQEKRRVRNDRETDRVGGRIRFHPAA